MKSLLIEDNLSFINTLQEAILPISSCDIALDGVEGVYMAETNSYDFVIMDLMLPKIGGLDVLRKIREKSTCPIIVVSSLPDKDKIVQALEFGADDYMVKPIESKELIARIKAVLRRVNNNFYEIYKHDNVVLDYRNKMFSVKDKYVKLSGKLYDVLEYLISNRNIVIPKEQLFNRVWGMDSDTVITVTEVYVCNLRKTLKKYGVDKYLKTIKNIGYMWEDKVGNIE